jgi:hypothetical protein
MVRASIEESIMAVEMRIPVRVQGYQTSDGGIYDDEGTAKRVQARLDFIRWAEKEFGGYTFDAVEVADKVLEDWEVKPLAWRT